MYLGDTVQPNDGKRDSSGLLGEELEVRDSYNQMDTSMGASKFITPGELKLNRTSEDISGRNCCSRALFRVNAFIWKNQARLLKSDHLNAAPCVSTSFLAILRIAISLVLVIQTIFTILETNKHDTSF